MVTERGKDFIPETHLEEVLWKFRNEAKAFQKEQREESCMEESKAPAGEGCRKKEGQETTTELS